MCKLNNEILLNSSNIKRFGLCAFIFKNLRNFGQINKRIIFSCIVFVSLCVSASSFAADIFDAIEDGDYKEVKRLIEQEKVDINTTKAGVLIDEKYIQGGTPLHFACSKYMSYDCEEDNIAIVKLIKFLIKNGAKESVNEVNDNGQTPLHRACKKGNIDIVKFLFKHGAKESVNKANDDGYTPLYFACKAGNSDLVEFLLENGAKESVNKVGNFGYSPLFITCIGDFEDKNGRERDCEKIAQLLLKNGADINKADNEGDTPLYMTCFRGNISMMKLLIENNVNIDEKSKQEVAGDREENGLYFNAAYQYDKEINKSQFILNMQKKNLELFECLVRIAFGRIGEEFSSNKHQLPTFFTLYDLIKDENIFKEIFGVKRKNNIIKFIKEVAKNNFFVVDESFFEKYEFFDNLNVKRKENKLIDCIVITEEYKKNKKKRRREEDTYNDMPLECGQPVKKKTKY